MISLLPGFNQGKPPCKTFSFANFLFSQIKQRRNSNRLHMLPYFDQNIQKEATDEAPFSRNYSLNPLMNFS